MDLKPKKHGPIEDVAASADYLRSLLRQPDG